MALAYQLLKSEILGLSVTSPSLISSHLIKGPWYILLYKLLKDVGKKTYKCISVHGLWTDGYTLGYTLGFFKFLLCFKLPQFFWNSVG